MHLRRLSAIALCIVLLHLVLVHAQNCSKTKLCATGCCSQHGFCGTSEEHCGSGCLSTCDFKLGCDAKNPCKNGECCSKFGLCGFGPDFCSKENCVDNCNAKTYCDPGGYGTYAEVAKCPLNVCCSKRGYCGITEEYCGTKKVARPSCAVDSQPMKRVVGYFEGWAKTRACNLYNPESIPNGVYTHLNYAFATIDPKTFRIAPAAATDPKFLRRLVRKKKTDPNLKVFIAIGGRAFNDPGPTATTFSDIARSDANSRTFIKSLVSFINTYDLDGVDIHWEYPGAKDRGGRSEDFGNLPRFLRNIKSALTQNGNRNGLSIAIPATYWYLQHFNIKEIAKTVDFFNVKTYDQHGVWNTPETWLGNQLNSHTNMTEIADAMDLLWRNNIQAHQINLGLAFYSRTFTVSSTDCMSPGCLFDSGGLNGHCSRAVGVLSNPDVLQKAAYRRASVTLDNLAMVKILTLDREWLTYDDGDTWKLKVDWARAHCIGGVMVWAVSQDTSSGLFSRQLQNVTGYRSDAVISWTDDLSQTTGEGPSHLVRHDSCTWSNCGQSCPSGWTIITRDDPYKTRVGELMTDPTQCPGDTTRTFCCPPGDRPTTCGWYHHNNGKCNPQCPLNAYEIASLKTACNNGKSQVACCTKKPRSGFFGRGELDSMKIWSLCQWYGKEPSCALNEPRLDQCAWDNGRRNMLVSSWDGSGAQTCKDKTSRGPRPYCCPSTTDTSNTRWKNCGWYDGFSNSPIEGMRSNLRCNSGCPRGMIKVTVDKGGDRCPKGGAAAYCCDADVTTTPKDNMDRINAALKSFASNPSCSGYSCLLGLDALWGLAAMAAN
ncbi:hypothetical protein EsH8_V_001160 [Colletotrichum jinshuiense]